MKWFKSVWDKRNSEKSLLVIQSAELLPYWRVENFIFIEETEVVKQKLTRLGFVPLRGDYHGSKVLYNMIPLQQKSTNTVIWLFSPGEMDAVISAVSISIAVGSTHPKAEVDVFLHAYEQLLSAKQREPKKKTILMEPSQR